MIGRFMVAGVAAVGAAVCVAQTAGSPGVTQINAAAIAYSAAAGKVYAVDKAHSTVVITDDAAGKTVATKVGAGPVSIAVNARTGTAYVANADDGTVSVIDGRTDAVVATLKVGAHPYAIAMNSAKGEVYVSRTYSDEMMVIRESPDGATDSVTGVKFGSPDVLAVNETSGKVYMVGYESETVGVMDGESKKFSKLAAGVHLWGLVVNRSTGVVYATRTQDREVLALLPDGTRVEIATGSIPCAIAVNAKTNRAYAVNYADDSVTVIDGGTEKAIATMLVGKRPEGVAVDEVRNRIYVTNTLGGSVTVIDGVSNKVLETIPAGKNPYAVVVNPVSGKVHVADLDEVATTVIIPR